MIKPVLVLPSSAINYSKKYILTISQICVIISSLLLTLHIQINRHNSSPIPTPIIRIVDQSRSMMHKDLTPSRRSLAQDLVAHMISDNTQLSRFQLITYASTPLIHTGIDYIFNLSPFTDQQGSTALGDAWLIAYDQINSGLDYKPIIITITDGGINTGYNLQQTAQILKTRANLWIVGISTGTQIVGYDEDGRGLTSTMDITLLSSLANSGHRYHIPDNAHIEYINNQLFHDLSIQYYKGEPTNYNINTIARIILGCGLLGRGLIYLNKP